MSLKEKIIGDLTAAMKAKDADKTSALRMVKAAIMLREKEKEQGAPEISDDEVMKALQSLVKQRRDSIEQYENAGRADLAAKEKTELSVIETYLPQAASAADIEQAVAEAIAETGASSPKDMGAVMKALMPKLAGKNADNRAVSEAVKAKLAN